MEEKIVEFMASFVCAVFVIAGVGFFLELCGAVVSTWKKILNK
jgi:hypothetical protein